jgi:hypothetical protein
VLLRARSIKSLTPPCRLYRPPLWLGCEFDRRDLVRRFLEFGLNRVGYPYRKLRLEDYQPDEQREDCSEAGKNDNETLVLFVWDSHVNS